jgi:hypothetical protein
MTTGLTGSYSFNGTNLTLQPTTGQWMERDSYGIDGGGHPIYSAVRSFELVWQLISTSDFKQIQDAYNAVSNTGTVAVDLPQYGANAYQFQRYSGATLREPSVTTYFEEYIEDARLLILNIRT